MLRMHINSIAKNQSGGVLVWVALVMTILLGLAGIAIDYARVYEVKSQLQRAADSAALVLARSPTREAAEESLTAYVNANTTSEVQGLSMTPTLTSWQVGQAEVGITATVNLTLSAILGSSEIPVSVSSTAAQGFTYLDVYTAVDMSGSLGIAADADNRTKLQALTAPYLGVPASQGCAFACHQPEKWGPKDAQGNYIPMYDFARQNGVLLREDVLDAAFQNFVSTYFTSNPNVTNHRRIDVIGFATPENGSWVPADWVRTLTTGQDNSPGPTSDVNNAQSALSKYPAEKRVNTRFELALPEVLRIMGPQGTGMTQAAPKKMLVLITDGARSNRRSNPRTVWPIDEPISGNGNGPSPGNCQAIRSQGFTLAVINIKYADLSGDHWFDYHLGTPQTLVKPDGSTVTTSVYPELSNALQQCASPGWYFEASDTGRSGIDTAMEQLIETINKSSLRLAF